MAKTKTLGIRTTLQLIGELEELKKSFDFKSYSEMLSCFAKVLKTVNQQVCQIQDHPRTWSPEDTRRFLALGEVRDPVREEISQLIWRRLRQRFGEDGVEALRRRLDNSERTPNRGRKARHG